MSRATFARVRRALKRRKSESKRRRWRFRYTKGKFYLLRGRVGVRPPLRTNETNERPSRSLSMRVESRPQGHHHIASGMGMRARNARTKLSLPPRGSLGQNICRRIRVQRQCDILPDKFGWHCCKCHTNETYLADCATKRCTLVSGHKRKRMIRRTEANLIYPLSTFLPSSASSSSSSPSLIHFCTTLTPTEHEHMKAQFLLLLLLRIVS